MPNNYNHQPTYTEKVTTEIDLLVESIYNNERIQDLLDEEMQRQFPGLSPHAPEWEPEYNKLAVHFWSSLAARCTAQAQIG